jgi:hypothetical protein
MIMLLRAAAEHRCVNAIAVASNGVPGKDAAQDQTIDRINRMHRMV